MRGGRSLDQLERAAAAHDAAHAAADARGGGGARPPRVAFVAVNVDPSAGKARALAAKRWPHLRHYWLDGAGIASVGRLEFVPNRVVLDTGHRFGDGATGGGATSAPQLCGAGDFVVRRWWDGTHGNVLRGPHGKSLSNGSQNALLAELGEIARGHD